MLHVDMVQTVPLYALVVKGTVGIIIINLGFEWYRYIKLCVPAWTLSHVQLMSKSTD